MIKECISKDWLLKAPGAREYKKIDLPNDYSVTQPRDPKAPGKAFNGFFLGGKGTYVKYLKLDETKKHFFLDIDGAYMCANVRFNEDILLMHPHGYAPVLVDLTEKAHPGKTNKLVITTEAIQPSTRWYSGAGIYRDVFLWAGGDIRIEPRDIFITTPSLDGKVNAVCTVTSDRRANNVDIVGSIVDRKSNVVAKYETKAPLKVGRNDFSMSFEIKNPEIWDIDNPYLYTLEIEVFERGNSVEKATETFGIRTISIDVENGFRLNGKTMKLRGGCIHHDHGVLGAADYPAACRRKLTRLVEAGFNSLRIAHNPPSRQLLEMCDEMGILVMDEAFDMWREPKDGELGYNLWFADWWARDISSMVLRDRNHPCVISYSIGNEIVERDGRSDGAKFAKLLTDEIKKYDTTRPVTSALCGLYKVPESIDPEDYTTDLMNGYNDVGEPSGKATDEHNCTKDVWAKRTEDYLAPLDMAGYNYLFKRYESDHKLYPDRVIWGSETQVLNFYDSWKGVLENSHVIGDYTWTAYDNLGEAGTGEGKWARDGIITTIRTGNYPWRCCYQGDLDLCGFRRPQSYFREAVWIGGKEPKIFTTHPEHYNEGYTGTGWHWYDVHDTWTFDEKYIGSPVKCEVYTDVDEIEWFLNGKSVGKSAPEKAIATMVINYEPGEISVKAYKNGKECGHSSLKTTGAPVALKVTAESPSIIADGRDLCYFDIEIVDKDGNRVTDAKNEITCTVSNGTLLGVFSADPCNDDQYGSNVCHAFDGRAVAIIKTNTYSAKATLIAASEGLQYDFSTVEVTPKK